MKSRETHRHHCPKIQKNIDLVFYSVCAMCISECHCNYFPEPYEIIQSKLSLSLPYARAFWSLKTTEKIVSSYFRHCNANIKPNKDMHVLTMQWINISGWFSALIVVDFFLVYFWVRPMAANDTTSNWSSEARATHTHIHIYIFLCKWCTRQCAASVSYAILHNV